MAKILLIDDDEASGLLAEALGFRGHEVVVLRRVDRVLEDARRCIDGVGLVILDVVMPAPAAGGGAAPSERSSGMLAYRAIRARRPDLLILVFTANADAALADAIRADPRSRYVSRWSSPRLEEFLLTVDQMLGGAPPRRRKRPVIVHGRDDATMREVKDYLQNQLGLPTPLVLRDEPNLGRTLIEKFEAVAALGDTAFVVLTPDDTAASPGDSDAAKRRARQNVILELGFFLGRFGRLSGRVVLLHKGPLEIPSDLSGIAYVDISSGVASGGEEIRRELAGAEPPDA